MRQDPVEFAVIEDYRRENHHAAHARADARTALRTARSTFPRTVTEYPASSSAVPTFCRAAWLTAHRKGERGRGTP